MQLIKVTKPSRQSSNDNQCTKQDVLSSLKRKEIKPSVYERTGCFIYWKSYEKKKRRKSPVSS
ncbi:hypothetical protein T11_4219 [Trichinella zimbabwensis]|uniref:Uncharacterized protein n=1 Tax=Trichinella zimbabwensis TaxID=268475 RepID=A0A0V1H3P1_9BILA|nr:hypothetical protein T11_4219 [Trichinella zimbabwensis]